MMLASLFQFSFLCVISLANLCLGFAIASRLGWGPSLLGLFQLDRNVPTEYHPTRDPAPKAIDGEQLTAAELTSDADASDSVEPAAVDDDETEQSDVETKSELVTAAGID